MLVSLISALSFTKPETKVKAAELTEDQIAERRATPGLYKEGSTEIIKTWNELLQNRYVYVSGGQLRISQYFDGSYNAGVVIDGEAVLDSMDIVIGNLTQTVTDLSNIMGTNAHDSYSWVAAIDFNNLDTSNVTTMAEMFSSWSKLEDVNWGNNFSTSKVTDMNGMFDGCAQLTSLDLSKFDTSNVTDMSYMFSYCAGITVFDISNFDLTKVTNANGMLDFGYDYSAKRIKLPANMGTVSISLSYAGSGKHWAVTDAKSTAITSVSATQAGKIVDLYNSNNESLAPYDPTIPVPDTGVVANVMCGAVALITISMIAYVCTNKKRKVLAK